MSVSQIALRARKVFGNFEKRVPGHENQSREKEVQKQFTDHFHCSVGPTFSTYSHKATADNSESYPQNSKRGAVGHQLSKLRKCFSYLDPQRLE